jgi:hypothetical protein
MGVFLACTLAFHYGSYSAALNKLVLYFCLFVTVKCSPIKLMEVYENFQNKFELFHTAVVSSYQILICFHEL